MARKTNKAPLIISLYNEYSVKEIARKLKISTSYVYRVLRKYREFTAEDIDDKYKHAILTIPNYIWANSRFDNEQQIAEHFDISRSTLCRFKREHRDIIEAFYAMFRREESGYVRYTDLYHVLAQIEGTLHLCQPDAPELLLMKELLRAIQIYVYV